MHKNWWLLLIAFLFFGVMILIDSLFPGQEIFLDGKMVVISSSYSRPGSKLNPLNTKVVLKGKFNGEEIRIMLPKEILNKNHIPYQTGSFLRIKARGFYKLYHQKKELRDIELLSINDLPVENKAWVLHSFFHKDKTAFPLDEMITSPEN